MKYSKPMNVIKDGFLPWVEANVSSQKMKTDSLKFECTITELEQQVGKLLPEFTKEDVVVYLKSRPKVSAVVIRNFYSRCKTWLSYCKDTHCYDKELTDEDIISTVMYNVHIKEYEDLIAKQIFIQGEEEFESMLNEYINKGGKSNIALGILLIWNGFDADEIGSIYLNDIELATKSIQIGDKKFVATSNYQHVLLEQVYYDTLDYYGRSFVEDNAGKVLVTRGKLFRKSNKPLDRSLIYHTYVRHFTELIDRDFTHRQISTSGKFYRWYIREQAGETLQINSDGTRVNFDELTNYKAYKQFVESIN